MARTYMLPIIGLGSLTTTSFAQLATPATTGIEIVGIEIGQEASATSAELCIKLTRRSTASTLPTATTPVAIDETNTQVSLLTGSTTTNATGIATVAGTVGPLLMRFPFNALTGLWWYPGTDPERAIRLMMKPSSFLTFEFVSAPATGTWSGQIYFVERP